MPKPDIPGVTARQIGKSRVVFCPWDIDRTYWEVLSPDHGKLLRNAVLWATNEEPMLSVHGVGLLEVTQPDFWETAGAVEVQVPLIGLHEMVAFDLS